MDGLEVFGADVVLDDTIVLVESDREVSDNVFDELGVFECFFGDELFVGAFEHCVNRVRGGGFEMLDQIFDPHCSLKADCCFDSAPLVVGAVCRDFFGAWAQACCRCCDFDDEVLCFSIGGAGEGDLVVHQPGLSGDGGGFFDEVGE